MVDKFTVGFKPQNKWGWLAATDFFLGGMGAGAFLISMFFGISEGMITGLIAVAFGALALLIDLGRPERFFKAPSRFFYSWISRGTIFTTIFLVFGVLYVATEFIGLPWSREAFLGQSIAFLAAIGAIGIILYTGFFLAHSASIPFWNTPLLPLLFALFSLISGVGALFILLPVLNLRIADIRSLQLMNIILLISSLLFIWIYILNMFYSTLSSRESVRILIKGEMSWPFLVWVNAFGMIMPLAMTALIYFAQAGTEPSSSVMFVAGFLALLGGFYFRYSILRAGVYAPLNPLA